MKREVAADEIHYQRQAGFPWSKCQFIKLATSHCNSIETSA